MHERKALCTVAAGEFAGLHEIARPGLEAYAKRHGWELVVGGGDAYGRPPAWAKVPLLAEFVRRYELVAWIDADAVIVDDSRDLASELRFGRELYLVEHRHEPSGEVTANTGVLLLRGGRWAERFLAAVWAQEDLVEHRWWENAAVMRLLGYRIDPQPAGRERRTRWLRRVRFLDVAWNSTPHWHASSAPRIVHFAGLPLAERRERMLAAAIDFASVVGPGRTAGRAYDKGPGDEQNS
jgi:galactosyl transferase GMA12/MNN10 family